MFSSGAPILDYGLSAIQFLKCGEEVNEKERSSEYFAPFQFYNQIVQSFVEEDYITLTHVPILQLYLIPNVHV